MNKEISIFKISKAKATYNDGNLSVKLFYPRNPKELTTRLPENLEFGVKTIGKLLKEGYSEIATPDFPFRPADGGSIYLFKDNVILFHRRDKGAPMHKLWHSASGGYTDTLDSTFSEKGLIKTCERETAEEQLLITRDKNPRLIVPKSLRGYTLQSAKNLELNLKLRHIDIETLPSRDKLEVFYEDGEHIFTSEGRGFLDLLWEGSTSFSLMQIISLPLSSDEVLPIDAEGFRKGDKWIHFNRESYLVSLKELSEKQFGIPLENPKVYQTKFEKGIPIIHNPEYNKPFFGADEKEVTHPHIFCPENHLIVCLDGLNVPGYKGKRLEIQKWKIDCILNNKSMIPDEFLVK